MALPSSTYDIATLVNPTSSLTDFTLVVDLSRMSSAWWGAVDTADATKGRAAKDSGPTELACDWIDFDSVNETGLLRVKWSGTLATSGTQTLRVYPPMAANASVAASDTYGRDNAYGSQVLAYWPMNDSQDRTANGRNLTTYGAAATGVGETRYGGGIASAEFFGKGDYMVSTLPRSGADQFLMLAWVHPDTDTSSGATALMHGRLAASNNAYLSMFTDFSGYLKARDYDGISIQESPTTSIPVLTANAWQHVMTYRNGTAYRVAAVDGTFGVANTNTLNPSTDDIWFGASNVGGIWQYDGCMAEAMVLDGGEYQGVYEYEQSSDQAAFWGAWTNVAQQTGGGAWTPLELGASLALWLDADDASTITLNGSTVSQWSDKSGNNHHVTQATAAAQPTYEAAAFQGKPTLSFDDTDDMLAVASSTVSANGDLFFGAAFQFKAGVGNWSTIVGTNASEIGSNTGELFIQRMGTRSQIGAHNSGRVDTQSTYAVQVADILEARIATVGRNGGTSGNGGTITVTATGPSQPTYLTQAVQTWSSGSTTRLQIGGKQQSVTNWSAANISEVVVCSQDLSTDNRQKLEGYLAHKWSLAASLPADHPYKTFPPSGSGGGGSKIAAIMHHRRMMGIS